MPASALPLAGERGGCNRPRRRGVYAVTMRMTRIAISLGLALMGLAGCTSEEEREKARLRAEIEEKLAEYRSLLDRRNELEAALRPEVPPAPDNTTNAYEYVLSNDPDSRSLALQLQQLERKLDWMRDRIADREERLAKREAGEADPTEAAVRRLYGLEWSRTDKD